MNQYIIDLQSFRVEALTAIEAQVKAEELLRNCSFIPKVEAVEEVD